MTIDRLYSKRYLLYKLTFVSLLPLLTELLATLFDAENAFVYLFVSIFLLGLAYTVPFLLTLKALRREAADSLGSIIIWDAAYLLFPAIISTVLCDAIFSMAGASSYGQGFFSMIVIAVLFLITASFWLLFLLFRKKH